MFYTTLIILNNKLKLLTVTKYTLKQFKFKDKK